ncbi:unnamed protein product [Adineta steineri]|uniref:Uncharacterized protein n=1 Tax=Adineta steineri TaxID=433720 RepID=A0A818UFL8_9BILA|nr:unnamed protein product [Adineta steineri]
MFSSKVKYLLVNSSRIFCQTIHSRLNHQTNPVGLRSYFDKEIHEHKKTGRLPTTFNLNDLKYFEILSRIRSKSDRLSYLRSLIPIIKTPPTIAIPEDSGGVHSGFLCPYRILRQHDFINMSTWNYFKAQRLNENLLLNCSGLSSLPLAQLIIDMRANFNLLNEPWWPILTGVSDDVHQEIIDVLKTKYQLHGAHLSTWETQDKILDTKDLTLICANRGETIYEIDSNIDYIVQIAGDNRQCCLGNATDNSNKIYKNIVKLESKTKSFNTSKRILTSDLFSILASLKMKGLFYKKIIKDIDDEKYNIKSKARSGLISN